HNVGSMPYGPADGLWIPPAFVADRDTEGQGGGLKDTTARAWCIDALFRGVDLDLVLKARYQSVLIDNHGSRYQCAVNEAFRSENDGDVCFRGCSGDDGPGAFEELGI